VSYNNNASSGGDVDWLSKRVVAPEQWKKTRQTFVFFARLQQLNK
jgi:hypothetical protein